MTARSVSWAGVFPAIVTPFARDGGMDLKSFASLLDLLIREGISGVVVAGSTGEFYSLSDRERVELIEFAVAHANGRIPVIAGTSAIGTRETLELTRRAQNAGAAGCMVLPPPYCLPTTKEVLAYFRAVADVGLPVMIYNNPLRTGVNITAAVAADLAKIEGVAAFKDSNKDLYAAAETVYAISGQVACFAGLEPYGAALISRGAVGMVSTISNVCAPEVVTYFKTALSADQAANAAAQRRIDELYHLLAKTGLSNFAFVKAAMSFLGRPGGLPRLPHLPPDDTTAQNLRNGLSRLYAGEQLAAA